MRKIIGLNSSEDLSKLKVLVKAQDQTAKVLRSELQVAQNTIKDLQAQVEAGRRRGWTIDPAFPDQRNEVDSLRKAVAGAQYRVTDMERSLSWRITAPLRILGKTFVKS